jgi:hypothetical protein
MKISELLTESANKTAVVGWGRGMGHKGHMYLAQAVIEYAQKIGAQPFFFVSETVGKDDPLTPQEKLAIYKKVFPKYAGIFHSGKSPIPVVDSVAEQGYDSLVFVVGADQKQSFQFLGKQNKTGNWNTKFGQNVKVISRQDTGGATANLEGPRATPMREVLKNPNASDKEKFAVWRDGMPDALTDKQVLSIMKKVESRLNGLAEADQPMASSSPIPGTPQSIRAELNPQTRSSKSLDGWMRG